MFVSPEVEDPPARTVAHQVVQELWSLGVQHAFCVIGGAIVRVCAAVHRHPQLQLFHARHESGAGMMACEASLATDRPTLVLVTSGPGLSNAWTGLQAAAGEGAKVLCICGATEPGLRERFAFQETWPAAEQAVDASVELARLDTTEAVGDFLVRLRRRWRAPTGHVAVAFVSAQIQAALAELSLCDLPEPPRPHPVDFRAVADALANRNVVCWVGYGARRDAQSVRALVDRLDARVVSSPRAKGIFPESDSRYLGVSGTFGGHDNVQGELLRHPPDVTVVLGSRLSESTSGYDPVLAPAEAFIHVDIDSSVFGRAFPQSATLGIPLDVGVFCRDVLEYVPPTQSTRPRSTPIARPRAPQACDGDKVHPLAVMNAIQRRVVDHSNAVVMADAGNAFAWTNEHLRFDSPGRYRVSVGFAAMTHAVNGVLGFCLATGRPGVAVAGDGAMLMNNELSTAVAHGVDATWIVFNDAQYGMIHHGMAAIGLPPFATQIPQTDFAAMGRALGARGVVVSRAEQLDAALDEALRTPGPFVIDVRIDPSVSPSFGRRNARIDDAQRVPISIP